MMCLQMLLGLIFFFVIFCSFFSLCCHPASPQISSFTLPSSDWAVVLGLASGSCPGCHHVLMRKGPCGLGPCWWWFMSSSLFSITGLKMEQVCLIQSVKSNWKKERGICCEHSCAGERRDCCDAQQENCVALSLCCACHSVLNSWYAIPSFFSSLLWLSRTFGSGHCDHCRHWWTVTSVAPLWRRRLDS